MANPSNPDDLMVRVAWLYYMENLTQKEIAYRLKIDRVKVLRLLKKARATGLVEIRLANVPTSHLALEQMLRERLGLTDVRLIPTSINPKDLRPALGQAAACYLSQMLRPNLSVGLGMGRTLAEIPKAIEQNSLPTRSWIEMVGGINRGPSFDSYRASALLAERCGGDVEHVFTPIIVESTATRLALLSEPRIRQVLEHAARCDLALVSIGTVDCDSFLFQTGYCKKEVLEALRQAGAAGDLLGHFLDVEGHSVPSPIEGRLIGLALEDLRQIPLVVCVSGGAEKAPGILGAVRGGYVNVLITDENTAHAILELAPEREKEDEHQDDGSGGARREKIHV